MSTDRYAPAPRRRLYGVQQTEPDRAVITDDDREMCAICGELPANGLTMLHLCKRCERAVEDERDRGY